MSTSISGAISIPLSRLVPRLRHLRYPFREDLAFAPAAWFYHLKFIIFNGRKKLDKEDPLEKYEQRRPQRRGTVEK